MIILGIDPALNHVGYALVKLDMEKKTVEALTYGLFPIQSKDPSERKLLTTFQNTQFLIDIYGVSCVGFEKAFHNPQRAHGGFLVREAIGAIKVAVAERDVPLSAYTPQVVKKVMTGKGNADKAEVIKHVCRIYQLDGFRFCRQVRRQWVIENYSQEQLVAKKMDHIADALAIGYCQAQQLIKEGENESIQKKSG